MMLNPGDVVHERYRVERLVGQGAMGAVYAAADLRLGRTVALKLTLLPDLHGATILAREAQILAALSHPALPVVSDTFALGQGQCLVMSYVPGPTLADILAERGAGFAPETVRAWVNQILVVLEYLHTRQPPVLHRDIKPQNLKLTPEGQIILLDFGLARSPLLQTRLADQRSMVGYTLAYAPLEQVRGEDTDPSSDLFALGATLYHLLTGTPPPDALERAAARLTGQPDPLRPPEINPPLDQSFRAVLMASLALDPGQRPTGAAAMRAALADPGTRVLVATHSHSPRRGKRRKLGERNVIVLVLLFVMAFITLLLWAPDPPQPPVQLPTVTAPLPFSP